MNQVSRSWDFRPGWQFRDGTPLALNDGTHTWESGHLLFTIWLEIWILKRSKRNSLSFCGFRVTSEIKQYPSDQTLSKEIPPWDRQAYKELCRKRPRLLPLPLPSPPALQGTQYEASKWSSCFPSRKCISGQLRNFSCWLKKRQLYRRITANKHRWGRMIG